MNMDKVMPQIGKITRMLLAGESRPFTSTEKAKWVAEHCKHTKRKDTACLPCIANAISQYEVHAAHVQKVVDCAIICPRCKDDPETVRISGRPMTHHRVYLKKRRPSSPNDWKDVRCLAAPLYAAWDKLR